jgi:prepilin-type N-terminal cleavage/methylation domain-containing protein
MVSSMRASKGFTLVELAVVVAIIAVAIAITVPNFWPAIDSMTLEGTGRHLGNYGRAVMAQSALIGEELIVKIDFEKQEYWTERLPKPESLLKEEEELEKGKTDGELSTDLFADSEDEANLEQLDQMAEKMRFRMEQFARQAVESRATNVKQEGVLGDMGPLFEKEFKLDDKEDEQDWEYRNYLLGRTKLDQGIIIESLRYGATGKEVAKGTAEIEVFPMGLGTPIIFYLVNEAGDYFTVAWDPITTGTHLYAGKETSL